MTDQQLHELAANKAHREARSLWVTGAVISACFAVSVVAHQITEGYAHPMLVLLAIGAAVASVYWTGKAIRHWTKPRP